MNGQSGASTKRTDAVRLVGAKCFCGRSAKVSFEVEEFMSIACDC